MVPGSGLAPNSDWGLVRKQVLRRSRPLLVWGRVGLAVSCLAGWWACVCVCACVSVWMGTRLGGGDATELGLSLTRGPSGDSSPPPPPPPHICCSRLQARRRQED